MPLSYSERAKIVDCDPEAIIQLRLLVNAKGVCKAAKRYGVSRVTVWRWLKVAAQVDADEREENEEKTNET